MSSRPMSWLQLFMALMLLTKLALASHPNTYNIDLSGAGGGGTKNIRPKRVAIIGAGAAGTSAAFHLRKYASETNIPVNISIFDRSDYIGGRSTTVNAFESPNEPVELGASIFVKVNYVLMNATHHFNLSLQDAADRLPPGYSGPTLGIWNGAEFVLTQRTSDTWWDTGKLFWRYGLAPLKALRLMRSSVDRFLQLYEPGIFPWSDLSEQAQQLDLLPDTTSTGAQLLKSRGIGDLFANEVIQAATRVNYAQNLGVIHGLETLVCLATDGAVSVKGGNWLIFQRLAQAGAAAIHLSTAVEIVYRGPDGRYRLKTKTSEMNKKLDADEPFDEVIVAAPPQFTELKFENITERLPEEIPYVKLHVTLFSSPHMLAPAAFNLAPDEQVPVVILTTLHPSENPGSKPTYAGKAGFFSISLLRPATNPKTYQQEYIYKIFSPEPVTSTFLAKILGIDNVHGEELSEEDVSWIYKKIWEAYPVELPRVTFPEIQLGPNLWTTSAIESFISTMETNALSGANVAKLMVNAWSNGPEDNASTYRPDAGQIPMRLHDNFVKGVNRRALDID